MPRFSLLVAFYNNFEYFVDCYSSLKKQTLTDYEIIIVDDCSTDGSFEKMKDLVSGDTSVKLFRNERNCGVGFTKRRCIEESSGDILGFVDSDDALMPDALEVILRHYQTDKISAVYSQFMMCDKSMNIEKTFTGSEQVRNNNIYFFNIFLKANHFFTFRKSAYQKTSGINPELTSAVDQDLYLKLYETGDFKFVKKPLYLYRLHTDGVSQTKSKKAKLFRNWHSVILETLERRKINRLYNKEISDITNLPEFIYSKQNTIYRRLKRKLRWTLFIFIYFQVHINCLAW